MVVDVPILVPMPLLVALRVLIAGRVFSMLQLLFAFCFPDSIFPAPMNSFYIAIPS
jgi:hypothetical protein